MLLRLNSVFVYVIGSSYFRITFFENIIRHCLHDKCEDALCRKLFLEDFKAISLFRIFFGKWFGSIFGISVDNKIGRAFENLFDNRFKNFIKNSSNFINSCFVKYFGDFSSNVQKFPQFFRQFLTSFFRNCMEILPGTALRKKVW